MMDFERQISAIEENVALMSEDDLMEELTDDEIEGMEMTMRLNTLSDESWTEDEGSGFERDLRRYHR